MAQPKTNRPTGLTVKRSDENFTFTWKIGDADYRDGQTMQVYHQYAKKWVNVASVAWGTTKKTVVIPLNRYYPNTKTKLTTVRARVRGNRKKYWVEDAKTRKTTAYDPTVSDWSTVEFAVLKPSAPSIKATVSTAVMASCTFEWTHHFAKDVHPWITDIQWQSQLVKECTTANGAELSWASNKALDFREGTTSSSSSITIDEDTSLLADDSYTRWVRVRSRGPAGFSDWKYARHVYARPYQAKLISADVVNSSDGGYMCKVVWRANAGHAHPIDQTIVQYVITNPVDGVQCPDGLSWTDAFVARDTSDIDAASFSIGNVVDNDQCMFVRVNTTHDKNTTNGKPELVAAGYLSDPDGLTVNMPETRRASVSANNNALPNNPDSFLAVVYMTSSNPEGFVIGVIPHGATSTTVQAPPEVAGETAIFGVYAVVGEYSQVEREDGVSSYRIDNTWLRSKGVVKQGGDVPSAPSNVRLSMTDTVGTIKVDFDWNWRKATAAELSWADHADAWESTAKPSTFVIDNTHAGTWNISGLATGKTWYVRVRLTSGSGDGKTYGAYSDIASIDLSSAPAVPVLSLSSGVITEEGTVTASWSYASGDGTAQANAEVAEVTTEGGTTAYTPVATTHTATNVAINAETVGWLSGEIHTLVVRVVSDSGRESTWSDPVSVAVADPITAEITDTSLVNEVIEENAREYSGDMVSYESDIDGAPVTSLTVNIEPVQSGSGDPSPDNVRPISGWDAIKIYHSGENTEDATEYDISLSDAGTVYGGTLDVVSGELTVDRVAAAMESLTWYRSTSYANPIFYATVSGKSSDYRKASCSFLRDIGTDTIIAAQGFSNRAADGDFASSNGNAQIYARLDSATTVQDFVTAVTGQTIVYPLANPQTYQLTPQQVTSLLGVNNVWSDAGSLDIRVADDVRDVMSLKEMPLSVTVEGAGEGGTTSVIVERSESYHVDRPDETEFHGFEGETIAIYTQTGENPVAFDLEDLLGSLDDEASYRIIATVQDGLGQSAEVIQEFEVHWTHQASMPMATAEIIDRHMIAVITPTAENAEEGDVCDIYRLSVDKPELIYPNAEFGVPYVDPYPAIGPFGGHRVVFKTANGDYITADNRLAWVDLTEADGDTIDSDYTVIDFDRGRILINRNLDIENAWKKDFKETQYLGGSIQGDWNPAVSREAKVATVAVSILDQETIQAMRRLAVHAGICHIRTSDGSSYAANIDVSDSYSHDTGRMVIEYDLSITRIESEDYDGMTYAEWKEANSPPSEENVVGTGEVDYMILTS